MQWEQVVEEASACGVSLLVHIYIRIFEAFHARIRDFSGGIPVSVPFSVLSVAF